MTNQDASPPPDAGEHPPDPPLYLGVRRDFGEAIIARDRAEASCLRAAAALLERGPGIPVGACIGDATAAAIADAFRDAARHLEEMAATAARSTRGDLGEAMVFTDCCLRDYISDLDNGRWGDPERI